MFRVLVDIGHLVVYGIGDEHVLQHGQKSVRLAHEIQEIGNTSSV